MKNEYKPKVEKIIVEPKEDLLVVGESKGYIAIVKDQGRITYNATGKSNSDKESVVLCSLPSQRQSSRTRTLRI